MMTNVQKQAGCTVLVEERRQKILDLVNERGFISLAELAQALEASESTIRRDLDYWGQQGFVKRTHGGAVAPADNPGPPPLGGGPSPALEGKQAIPTTAAACLWEGGAG